MNRLWILSATIVILLIIILERILHRDATLVMAALFLSNLYYGIIAAVMVFFGMEFITLTMSLRLAFIIAILIRSAMAYGYIQNNWSRNNIN